MNLFHYLVLLVTIFIITYIVQTIVDVISIKKAKRLYMESTNVYDKVKYVSKKKRDIFDINAGLRTKREKYTIFMEPNDCEDLFRYIRN